MGSRSGYAHQYGFSSDDDEIISSYNREPLFEDSDAPFKNRFKGFAFEIITNFILKTSLDHDELMDSEKLVSPVPVYAPDHEYWLYVDIEYRLSRYWMSKDEILKLARQAFETAKRAAAGGNPKYASLDVIPVVIGLDVLTVQLEGETVDDARGRAIRPECLIPLNMCPVGPVIILSPLSMCPTGLLNLPREVRELDFDLEFVDFLLRLPTVRVGVEGVDKGLALMDVCPICLRGPTAGAEISSLPCKHAFHNHCVVHWLLKSRSCPLCRFEIVVNRRGVS